MKFGDLWDNFSLFRSLFIGPFGIWHDKKGFDLEIAMRLWNERYPKIEWGFCAEPECRELVQVGEYCTEHMGRTEMLPTWKWHQGILYRYKHLDPYWRSREWGYVDYARHVAQRRFHEIPPGFQPVRLDGNPFNFRPINIIILSKVSVAALEAGVLDVITAVKLDKEVPHLVIKNGKGGRPPVVGTYGYRDISKAAGMTPAAVRKAVERGTFDPLNFLSVVKFVKSRQSKG